MSTFGSSSFNWDFGIDIVCGWSKRRVLSTHFAFHDQRTDMLPYLHIAWPLQVPREPKTGCKWQPVQRQHAPIRILRVSDDAEGFAVSRSWVQGETHIYQYRKQLVFLGSRVYERMVGVWCCHGSSWERQKVVVQEGIVCESGRARHPAPAVWPASLYNNTGM